MARSGFAAIVAALLTLIFTAAAAAAAAPPNASRATAQTACDRGDAEACFYLADIYERGTGVNMDLGRALSFHIRACDLRKGVACYRAGTLLDSASQAPDLPRAVQFYRNACDLKDANGCFRLGLKHHLGHGVAKNETVGASLMDKGCAMGSTGCKYFKDRGLLPPRVETPIKAVPPPARAAAPQAAIPAIQGKRTARAPVAAGSVLARGIALYRQKEFQPALAVLLQAAKGDPNDPRIFAYLADTYGWLGMDVEARMAADTARRLDPNALDILR